MSIVIFSDTHFDSGDPYKLSQHKENALRIALEYVIKNDLGVHAGDLFHRRNPNTDILIWVSRIFSDVLGNRIKDFITLVGNHGDNEREFSPMEVFANGAKCYGAAMTFIGSKSYPYDTILFRGWLSNSFEGLNKTPDVKYLITHARVKEWVFGSSEKAFAKSELLNLGFDRILLGDNHKARDEGVLVSVGSLCPKDFADRDVVAGFVVFDPDHNEYKRVTIPDYPIFRIVEIYEHVEFEPNPEYIKANIIRLKFIGSPKFVQDKSNQKLWLQKIWAMQPYHVDERPEIFQINPELALNRAEEIPIEEEIKQAAKAQDWSQGSLNVALGC